jgi:CheY-like chemotaxis protein
MVPEVRMKKILLAEDDSVCSEALNQFFTEQGFETIVVKDGIELLETFIKTKNIRIVITDLNMPNMNGVSAAKVIKHFVAKDIPIVAITGGLIPEDLDDLFIRVFTKPLDIHALINVIKMFE